MEQDESEPERAGRWAGTQHAGGECGIHTQSPRTLMRIYIFLQARLGSTRLPQKILLKIVGKTLLELLVERLRKVQGVEKLVLVTGPEEKNLPLIKEAERLGIAYFCGSEENLLDRFYQAAKVFQPDAILRATGDNPFLDPALITQAVERFLQGDCDILFLFKNYPLGLGIDIFSRKSLDKVWAYAKERYRDPQAFDAAPLNPAICIGDQKGIRRKEMICERDLSSLRLTVDYPEDFELAKKIYEALYPKNPNFDLKHIVDFLEANPSLLKINKKYVV